MVTHVTTYSNMYYHTYTVNKVNNIDLTKVYDNTLLGG